MATSDKTNYDANQNTYCQKNLETRAAINECREKILKLERDLRAASNDSKADGDQASMRKGIVEQMLNTQESHGDVTIESHTTACYNALKMAISKAFPEIDEGSGCGCVERYFRNPTGVSTEVERYSPLPRKPGK